MLTEQEVNRIASRIVHLLRRDGLRELLESIKEEHIKETETPVSIKEAAKILNLSVNTLYHKKEIPHIKAGHKVLYLPSQLREYLKMP